MEQKKFPGSSPRISASVLPAPGCPEGIFVMNHPYQKLTIEEISSVPVHESSSGYLTSRCSRRADAWPGPEGPGDLQACTRPSCSHVEAACG